LTAYRLPPSGAPSQESFVVLPTTSKPLYLLSLLHAAASPIANALVFTKSVESANRLVKLLQFFEDAHARETGGKALVVRAYSSDLGGGGKAGERGRVLGAFGKGEIDMWVAAVRNPFPFPRLSPDFLSPLFSSQPRLL
jgi:ATP-dependent RNA helicase DDX51/DBP6